VELPFVGREDELASLMAATRSADARGRSLVVALVGEAGIGKTRLLRELERRVPRRTRFVWGRGSPLAKEVAFATLTEALESGLRGLSGAAVLELCGGRHRDLAAILPSVAVADEDSPPGVPPPLLAVFEALLALLARMASTGPLVLVLDDAHQADSSTCDFLSYLARNPLTAPLVTVLASRPETLAPEVGPSRALLGPLLRDGLAQEVRVEPLSADQLGGIAVAALGDEHVSDELVCWLATRTRGNPLYATGVLEDLRTQPSRRVVPASARERVREVAVSLAPPTRAVLELASAMGSSFTLRDLIVGAGPDAGIHADRLVAAGVFVVIHDGPRDVLEFAHPVIQEAVYDGLGPGRRHEMHGLVARTLADAPLAVRAYHVARSALPGDEGAIAVLVAAAGEAEDALRHRSAITQLLFALDLLAPGSPGRPGLLDRLAWQAACVGDHEVGIPALEELVSSSQGDDLSEAGARMRLASFLAWGRADLATAERHIRLALASFEKVGDQERVAAAINELAWISGGVHLGRQIAASRDAVNRAERLGAESVLMRALGSLGHGLAAAGQAEEGVSVLRRGLTIARRASDDDQVEWFTACSAEELSLVGRFADAAAVLADLDVAGRDASDLAYSRRAIVGYLGGQWTAALDDCRVVHERATTLPAAHSAWALSLGGVMLAAANRGEDARRFVAHGERVYADRALYWFSARHDWAVGMTAWFLDDLDEAAERLARAARRCREMGALFREVHALADLVDVLATAGRSEEAALAAERLEDCATVLSTSFVDGLSSFTRGVVTLAGGDILTADALFEAAGRRLADSPFLLARVLERRARICTGTQQIQLLSEAGRRYGALPAPVFETRVVAQLRRLGGVGRRAAQTVGPLTAREQEVLQLARRGLTSRVIAERLFVSERTIESHLERVYRKLGVSGRAGLTGECVDGGGAVADS